MSFEVDVSGVGEAGFGISTWTPGSDSGLGVFWPGEIGPGQWYRLAPQLDGNNSPGTSLLVKSEGVFIDGNGTHNAFIEIVNNGPNIAQFTINVISTPSHF